jgi:hypothetical protein
VLGASGRRARLLHGLDVGGGGRLARQSGVEGVGRGQQLGAVQLPQLPGHQLRCGGAGRDDAGGLGDGLIAGAAGVVVVDEVGHAAKQPRKG